MDLSVVVPVRDGGTGIVALCERVARLGPLVASCELILIDDASASPTRRVLDELASTMSFVRLVRFDQRRGQHAAIQAGLELTLGERVAVFDDDQAWAVDNLPLFLAEAERGAELVFGSRRGRRTGPLRRVGSVGFNLLCSLRARRWLRDLGGPKLLSGKALDLARESGGLPALIPRLGGLRLAQVELLDASPPGSRYGFPELVSLTVLLGRRLLQPGPGAGPTRSMR